MKVTIAVDPGLRVCGVAYFEDSVLKGAFLAKNPLDKERFPPAWYAMATAVDNGLDRYALESPDELVLEVPQVYRGAYGPNPLDLIEVAGVVGAVAATVGGKALIGYYPREWKRQEDKADHHKRVLGELAEAEQAAIEACPAYLAHNVYDAIGLGLFRLGRLLPGSTRRRRSKP